MAIAFDNSTDLGLVVGVTSLTAAHTVTGSETILFVICFGDFFDRITGATYNGVAMSLVAKVNFSDGNERWNYMFVLVAPATGSNNVVISASQAIAIQAMAVSYTGALQSGQPDSFNTGTNNAATLTVSTTVVATGCWLVGAWRSNTVGATAGSGTTQREGASGEYLADSNGTVGTGSQSLSYDNLGTSTGNSAIVSSFAPTVDSGHPTMRRWGGVPAMGASQGIGNKGRPGRMWGRRHSGIIVPHRFREVA